MTSFNRRDRIVAITAPGMASSQTAKRQVAAAPEPVPFQRGLGVAGATRIETARGSAIRAQKRGQANVVRIKQTSGGLYQYPGWMKITIVAGSGRV